MRILNVLDELSKIGGDSGFTENRRGSLKALLNFSKKVSVAATPLFFGNLIQTAKAQTSSGNSAADALNTLIVLEYLQYHFYNNALVNFPNLIPAGDKPLFTIIREQEKAHIDYLRTVIANIGGTARAALDSSAFDFSRTVGTTVTFTSVNTNYQNFLTAAVVLEDLTVRIYKGQLSNLLDSKPALMATVRIHTAQARHSAQVRELLQNTQAANLKNLRPWVSARRLDSGTLSLITAGTDIVTNDTFLNNASAVYDVDVTAANREVKSVQAGIETSNFSHFTAGKTLPLAGNDLFEARAISSASFDEYFSDVTAKQQINYYLKTGFKI